MNILQIFLWILVVIFAVAFTGAVLLKSISIAQIFRFCMVFGTFLLLLGSLVTITNTDTQTLLDVLSLKVFIIEAKAVFAGYGFILTGIFLAVIGLLKKKTTPINSEEK